MLLPIALMLAIGGCIVGLVLGVHDYPGPVLLVALLLPLLGWPAAFGIFVVANQFPAYAGVLTAGGILALGMFVASFGVRSVGLVSLATGHRPATPSLKIPAWRRRWASRGARGGSAGPVVAKHPLVSVTEGN